MAAVPKSGWRPARTFNPRPLGPLMEKCWLSMKSTQRPAGTSGSLTRRGIGRRGRCLQPHLTKQAQCFLPTIYGFLTSRLNPADRRFTYDRSRVPARNGRSQQKGELSRRGQRHPMLSGWCRNRGANPLIGRLSESVRDLGASFQRISSRIDN